MNFLSYLAGLITAVMTCSHSISPSELLKYEAKLRAYQNMTNINETTFQEIWTKGVKNGKTLLFTIDW